ncbi:MAG: type II toxin-antitoxin system RelE/ParE family toxin [Sulfuricurvum sp.]
MRIKYTERAREDLDEIARYISQDSIQKAIDYLYKLRNKIKLLTVSPYMGLECRTKGLKHDCRIMVIEKYLVFYTFDNDLIQIKRIFHHSVNYQEKPL